MFSQLQYSPFVWPLLISAAIVAIVAAFGWRQRAVPGGTPFTLMMLCALPWAATEIAALLYPPYAASKVYLQTHTWIGLASAATGVWFVLEFAGLQRWLTRTTGLVLAAPVALYALAMATPGVNRLLWLNVAAGEGTRFVRGPLNWPFTLYGIVLSLAMIIVLIWLLIRWPQHRWVTVAQVVAVLLTRAAFFLEIGGLGIFPPFDLTMMAIVFTAPLYLLALVRGRFFDVVPIARGTVVDRMLDGIIVVDATGNVADMNRAAENLLGIALKKVHGASAAAVLAPYPELAGLARALDESHAELAIPRPSGLRACEASSTPLRNRRGNRLGQLLVLHDATERKHAGDRLLEQQRALASTQERERLARELHDGLGQTLGYVKLRSQLARDLIAEGRLDEADACLENLAAVTQDAHTDVREFLLAVSAEVLPERAFLVALERYLGQFQQNYQIRTHLDVRAPIGEDALGPRAEVQLLRIIQEAMTNVRKHSAASDIHITVLAPDGFAEVVVKDNGRGFDVRAPQAGTTGYGLRLMAERAEEVGGKVQVHSAPDEGTTVIIQMPLRNAAPGLEPPGPRENS